MKRQSNQSTGDRFLGVRLLIWAWGTATAFSERVTTLVRGPHHESAEFANVVVAAAWFLPCIVNPHFLETSIYVHEVGSRIGQNITLLIFGVVFWYWLACLVIGSPAPLTYINGRLRPKTIFRVLGFAAAVMLWTTFARVLTTPGINPGTTIHGGLALWSCVCWIQLSIKIINERSEHLKRGELRRCEAISAPLPTWARAR